MWEYRNTDELYHFGIPGMKWKKGRKTPMTASQARVARAKAAYKSANKQYSKDYNKAYNYSSTHLISQYLGKKQKATSNANWANATKSANAVNKAKAEYKQAKRDNRAMAKANKAASKAIIKQAKEAYKAANKQYSKDYNKAHNYSARHMVSQFVAKEQKAESDKRWTTAMQSGRAADKAKAKYKAVKKKYR